MPETVIARGCLLETADDLVAEQLRRGKDHTLLSIPKDGPVPVGWVEKPTAYKTVKHVTRPKPAGLVFEDRIWRLFRNLGMEKLNTPDFALQLKSRTDPKTGQIVAKTKQVDVFAVHDRTVFIVECKTAESLKDKTLKLEIAEFAGNRNDFMRAATELLGFRPRLVMVLATTNISLGFNDVQDAREAGIKAWGDSDIAALEELAALAGQGARYQLYNMVFQGQKIKDMGIKVPALKGKMGGHTYYSFLMRPEDLLEIAYVHHRAGDSNFRDLTDSYQRMLKPNRIRQIRQYIEDNGGFFPGNIILNFDRPLQCDALAAKDKIEQLAEGSLPVVLTLPSEYGSAWIIDGQHRLYGFADTDQKSTETVAVLAFVQEDTSFQARVFVDINEKQQAVSKDLLWDLYEDLYRESKDEKELRLRAISRIGKTLNSAGWSPFQGSIRIPKEGNDGVFGFRSICYPIDQNGLVSNDGEQLYRDDYEQTVQYAAERIAAFYGVLRAAMPAEWAARENHFICTPTGFLILTGILSDLVSENLSAKDRNDLKAYQERMSVFLRPLIDHLQAAKKAKIDEYRGGGGAEARAADVRQILTESMGINSSWLDRRRRRHVLEERQALLKDVKDYLGQPESLSLEFKGSAMLDVGEFMTTGAIDRKKDAIRDSFLKTVVAFLNTAGGDLVLGVLETKRFDGVDNERTRACLQLNDRLVCGVGIDIDSHDFDWYTLAVLRMIQDHIGCLPLDRKLVDLELLPEFEGLLTCVLRVAPSPKKQYLDGTHFFVRRGPASVELRASEIDEFWDNRTVLSKE